VGQIARAFGRVPRVAPEAGPEAHDPTALTGRIVAIE